VAKVEKAKQPSTGKRGARQQYDRAVLVPLICAGLLEGKPMTVVLRELVCDNGAWRKRAEDDEVGESIPVRTVNQWREDDVEIANAFDEAFEAGKDTIAWRMRMTARGKVEKDGGDSTGDIERDRLIIYTDEKLLAKWDNRYGNRLALANDPKNPLLPAAQLTEAQLLAIAAHGIREADKNG
jgi:hypothetical protein